jgi:voltage-gated potassium channel Kch
MAPKAAQIRERRRVAEFEVEGELWRIEFRPFSSDTLREALAGDEQAQYDGICRLMGETVVGWNLLDDHDQEMPVQGAGMAWLRSVGLDYVRALFDGIVAEQAVPKASGSASSGGSRPAA